MCIFNNYTKSLYDLQKGYLPNGFIYNGGKLFVYAESCLHRCHVENTPDLESARIVAVDLIVSELNICTKLLKAIKKGLVSAVGDKYQ
jgi:hypothetical protein